MLCFGGSPPLAWGQPEPRRAYDIPLAVHPHSRGDNIVYLTIQHVTDGSPPLAWGQLLDEPGVVIVFDGSPPLAWGQRRPPPQRASAPAVHPHSRGDNSQWNDQVGTAHGSPPLAWGQPTKFTKKSLDLAVHPHSRGDNCKQTTPSKKPRGSPPLAWGQHGPQRIDEYRRRFTPTRVGTTPIHSLPLRANAVHPHSRGDNPEQVGTKLAEIGSPPLAWGQRPQNPHELLLQRFTPTRVGTTLTDHRSSLGVSGSPPLAWGQLKRFARRAVSLRFTPTRVGTTLISMTSRCELFGSPPLAWGQLPHRELGLACRRFTPTRVGTTLFS